jgi:hypothetical protein
MGQSYYPTSIGNTWEWYSNLDDSTYSEIISDIVELVDGSRDIYHNYSDKPNFNIKSNGNVYQYFGDNLEIWYDFTIAPKDTYYTNIYSSQYYVVVDSINGELFGVQNKIRQFTWINVKYPDFQSTQWLTEKFGKIKTVSFLGPIDSYVIGCKINNNNYGSLVNIENPTTSQSKSFNLFQNYPNPFNPTTTIAYSLNENGRITISIYDLLGNKVTTLVNEYKLAGNHSVLFNAADLPSGVYFCKITTGKFTDTKKILLIK